MSLYEACARAIVARERAREEGAAAEEEEAEVRAQDVIDANRQVFRAEEARRAALRVVAVVREADAGLGDAAARVRRRRSFLKKRQSGEAERRRSWCPADRRSLCAAKGNEGVVEEVRVSDDAEAEGVETEAVMRAGREPTDADPAETEATPADAKPADAKPAEASSEAAKQERDDLQAQITEVRADLRRVKEEMAEMERFMMRCVACLDKTGDGGVACA